MMALEPITRQEKIIAGKDLNPITRMEMFLKEYGGSSLVSPSGKKFKLTVDDNGVIGTTMVKKETVAEGDGAEFYTLAPTALSFRSTAPLSEFSEVQVNGETVDPENYTLEEGSTIVTFQIDFLKKFNVGNYEVAIVSDGEIAKGVFAVAAPELNEHGFYYNQPYTAYVAMLGGNGAFFIREDNTFDMILIGDGSVESGTWDISGNVVTATSIIGVTTNVVSSDGTEIYCNELATAFKLSDTSAVADEDYIYIYKEDLGGYEVTAIDNTKAEYGAIKTGINGIDTVKLADNMFYGCINLMSIAIPNSITSIGHNAFTNCSSLTSITIPNSVTSIGYQTFSGCDSLTSVVIPDSVTSISSSMFLNCDNITSVTIPDSITSIGGSAFRGCTSLTSIVIPNSVTSIGDRAFHGCTDLTSIVFKGTAEQWNAITKLSNDEENGVPVVTWNTNVPATYVQCSDGRVSLV